MKKLLFACSLVCCFGCQKPAKPDTTVFYFATNLNGTDLYITIDTKETEPHVLISTNFPTNP